MHKGRLSSGFIWWSRWESNPRPLECHSSALPTELRPHSLADADSVKLGEPIIKVNRVGHGYDVIIYRATILPRVFLPGR